MPSSNGPIVGIIGGSGLHEIPGLEFTGERRVSTPFGEPSAPYRTGAVSGVSVVFLQRHGLNHTIAPHLINYRANIRGFRELGVSRIISVNATGGIAPDLRPGDIVVPDQVLDMTQGARTSTFYEDGQVVHIDFTDPYCPELRALIKEAGKKIGTDIRDTGTYICVNGPRLESRAEIGLFGSMGADVVGMTGMPEAALARELEICMASISVVTNYAAGITGRKLTTEEVIEKMKESNERISRLVGEALPLIPLQRSCPCKDALEGASM
jgi:5'-methylthioadenosine phosphorylase